MGNVLLSGETSHPSEGTRDMKSLILDSQFGQYGYGAVGTALLDQVTVWPASTARTIVAAVQAEQVLETLDAFDHSWDTVVGFGFGCGPAAALVVAGRAARALFIDPPRSSCVTRN